MGLPDFICAGAQKSGTTWLYAQLSQHPQVFMPGKELNFFYRQLPEWWYQERFSGAAAGQRCGDISPNYAAFEGLAERIHETCPDAAIVHLLRNPVERAFSQWKMARHLGNIPFDIPFIEAFRGNLQYMQRRGKYATIIQEYARYWPLGERHAVFWYDDIRTRPAALLSEIAAFLRLDPGWEPQALHTIVAPSPEETVIDARDASEVAQYYAPFDRQLRSLLGIAALPWPIL